MDIQRVRRYAEKHPQGVILVWVSKRRTFHDAPGAITLCSDPSVSGRIIAAQTEDRELQRMLNELVDEAGDWWACPLIDPTEYPLCIF